MPTPPPPAPLPPSRRAFLLTVPAAGLAAGQGPAAAADDPAADFAAAARLAGLEFGAADRRQAAGRLVRQREAYRDLRRAPLPWALPPCAAFDPWPGPAPRPAPTGRLPLPPAADPAPPATPADLAFADLATLGGLLRRGRVTAVQLAGLYLERLQAHDARLFCVVRLCREEALRTAAARDAELAAGRDRGPLHGIPYGAKDLFAWPGLPTTFGAGPFANHVWDERATALQRLDEAGAVLVAKLSLGALAMGDLWYGGRTRNPWQPEQGSSGSSAGSAAAVAAGLVPFALGTETLGSIVSPCRQCGVGGLRPTFGTVSRHGAMPLSWTMDKVGVIARSARDAAVVHDAIRGADGRDPAAVDAPFHFAPERGLQGLRLGVLQQEGWPRRAEDRAFLDWLAQQGAAPQPVRWPEAPWEALLLMLHAEAASAFDQFVRDGLAAALPGQGDGDWPNQFRSARAIPAVEYLQASRRRRQLQAEMHAAFGDLDVVVAPTHGGPTLACTNLTGHPTYVLPVGHSERDGGRPTALALVGKLYGDGEVLTVAHAWQNATDHHRQRPALSR